MLSAHPLLSLALGAYAGLLVATWLAWTTGAAVTAEAVLAPGWVTAGVVALVASSVPALGTTLSRTRLHHLLLVVPAVVVATELWSHWVVVGPDLSFVGQSTFFPVALSGIAAVVVVKAADGKRIERIRAEQDPVVEWTARPARRLVRRRRRLYVLGGGLVAVGVVAGLFADDVGHMLLGTAIGSALGMRSRDHQGPRRFAVYPDAVLVGSGTTFGISLYPWSRLSGYTLADDALVLHRRIRAPVHCARSSIDDLDAVVRHLDRRLDRIRAAD